MDPITTAIVTALGQLGTSVVKDAYEALKAAIVHKCGVKSDLVETIDNLEKKPDATNILKSLEEEITTSEVGQDEEVRQSAQNLLQVLSVEKPDLGGKFQVDIENSQGVVIGDHTNVGGMHFEVKK